MQVDSDNNLGELALQALACQPLGVVVLDRRQRVLLWNRWMEQWSCIDAEQILQRGLNDLFPELVGGDLTAAVDSVLSSGSPVCWTQTVDPERLDVIEHAMTRGDREMPLHRVQISAISQGPNSLCLLQIDEAPYDPLFVKTRKPSALDGEAPAYLETDWLGVLTVDADGVIQQSNEAARVLFGYREEQLQDAPVRILFPAIDELPEADLKGFFEKQMRQSSDGLLEAATADGRTLQMQVQVFRSVQHPGHYVLCCGDLSNLSSAQETLFRQRELISIIYEQVADGLILVDDQGLIEHVNPVGLELLHSSETNLLHGKVSHWLTFVDESGEPLSCPASEALRRGTLVSLPEGAQLQAPDHPPVNAMASAMPLRNRKNDLVGVVVIFRAVSESRRMSSRLAWQSMHDPLTQLANRRQLMADLAQLIERTQNSLDTHTLLYIDLYNFSVINDTCGHNAGDELLRQFARLLSRLSDKEDTVARLGNDEFALLLANRTVDECRELADQLLWQIKTFSFPWGERRLKVGASIGAKVIDSNTNSAIDVLVEAGSACTAAREAGRNRIHFHYLAKDVTRRQSVAEWIPRITEALEEDRFVLYVQPIVPAGKVEPTARHYEVLVRMVDREGKLVPPGEFIPVAEHYGIIDELDRWTFERTISYLQRQLENHKDYTRRFSVNLSGSTIGDEDFREYVLRRFRETGVDPRHIQFEITETAAVRNFDRAMEFIRALKAQGCYFSLDDFGSGLSSFAYLKQLPVDFLKIDGSFIHNMEFNDVDYSMISTINHLGHIMGIRTVAECVENDNQLAMLREIGIDYVQGYALSQPKPMDQL
ncbi:EAL domain-containing protein [Porticoccus sp. W117]|uniref:putative bifunctional diguanylate cyclase/phosphodiesterase n=1 Tax=Porticoccus sp. W117 TaxID=3054777 RepID=UPI002594E706|nr:EAL domain-containing protein [Porticoccus sp. W117]MDM3871447.1 EAL domain-containing protein [Porticoccus sp. W117]